LLPERLNIKAQRAEGGSGVLGEKQPVPSTVSGPGERCKLSSEVCGGVCGVF